MTTNLIRFAPALILACQLLGGPALAQQPSAGAMAAARELVELKGGANMFDPVINNVVDQARGMLIQSNPQHAKELGEVASQLRTEFAGRRTDLLNEAAKNYANRFSESELKELVTFFKAPLGRKMLTAEPQVLDETFTFVQQQLAPRLGEEVLNRFRAEMKKKGYNL
jgi:hypothetical protein